MKRKLLEQKWWIKIPHLISTLNASYYKVYSLKFKILIHDSIYEEFKNKYVDYVKNNVKFGNPEDSTTVSGPLINKIAIDRTKDWIEKAEKQGAKILLGGNNSDTIFEPTIFENVPESCEISCEEVFAPITILIPYNSFNDAINITNSSKFWMRLNRIKSSKNITRN